MKKRPIRSLWFLLMLAFALSSCGGSSAVSSPVSSPVTATPVQVLPFKVMRILVLGQSIASNCNEHLYGEVDNVFQVSRDGKILPAKDPFEWAHCGQGSIWIPLGRKLIENGIAEKVIFMPIGVGGTRVRDWQEGGSAYPKLNDAVALIKKESLNFDFAFWHQGSNDMGTDSEDYRKRLTAVLADVDGKITIRRWLIALHSRCWGTYDPNIEAAQRIVAADRANNRFLGPNNNILEEDYRFDHCHLNRKGQEEMASMWMEGIRNAVKE
jgi:hypothetical protein